MMASYRVGLTIRTRVPRLNSCLTPTVERSIPALTPLRSIHASRSQNSGLISSSSPFASRHFSSSSILRRENIYNPYDIAETPEEAAELDPPVRYYKDTRFDEPDYDMPKAQVHAIYAEQRPADLFTNFEVSRDPEEWAHVERLLATPFIPPPPPHLRYPTPSGWSPPNPDPSLDWAVRRKKDHHYDIKVEDQWKLKTLDPVGGGGFQVTTVSGIEGDVWSFRRDALDFLTPLLPKPQKWQKRRKQEIETRVDEVECRVHFKGIHDHNLKDFLLSKGM